MAHGIAFDWMLKLRLQDCSTVQLFLKLALKKFPAKITAELLQRESKLMSQKLGAMSALVSNEETEAKTKSLGGSLISYIKRAEL